LNQSVSISNRSRPYQGVRVRDPVKELLRRKRSLDPHGNKTSAPTAVRTLFLTIFGPDAAAAGSTADASVASGDGGLQCTGWKGPPPASGTGLQPWSSPEYGQQDSLAQTLAYPATPLTADLYMQTLCPSYTMLTYTHTPLLTNFGTIPVAPAPAALPQMELPDSGLTYLPWTPPLTTISNSGVQFAPGSAALSSPPLVHMPVSMSLTTMIPQLESQTQILDLPQSSEHQLDHEAQGQSLDEDPGIDPDSPNLLDKLLEDQKGDGEEEDKDSYSSSIFITNV
uniref:OCA domain-containing protein n=1 Tax=Echeneis naucrates TaxID=173247 RepID=A0A665VRT0_ECHNA